MKTYSIVTTIIILSLFWKIALEEGFKSYPKFFPVMAILWTALTLTIISYYIYEEY